MSEKDDEVVVLTPEDVLTEDQVRDGEVDEEELREELADAE